MRTPTRLHVASKRPWRRQGLVTSFLLAVLLVAGTGAGAGRARADTAAPTAAPVLLYSAILGTTPDQQGFQYLALPLGTAAATQTFVNGATILDTTPQLTDLAGYFTQPPAVPQLNRHVGYSLTFAVQMLVENHAGSDKNNDGIDDRAGFSVTVLSSDTKGIELAFWPNKIWAQQDGDAEPPGGTLFTHAEEAAFNTTSGLILYTLSIAGDSYRLSSGGTTILSGQVRDYSSFVSPLPQNPYQTPNLIALSDNSQSTSAKIRFSHAVVQLHTAVYVPLVSR
jgi:hypothetical protein